MRERLSHPIRRGISSLLTFPRLPLLGGRRNAAYSISTPAPRHSSRSAGSDHYGSYGGLLFPIVGWERSKIFHGSSSTVPLRGPISILNASRRAGSTPQDSSLQEELTSTIPISAWLPRLSPVLHPRMRKDGVTAVPLLLSSICSRSHTGRCSACLLRRSYSLT